MDLKGSVNLLSLIPYEESGIVSKQLTKSPSHNISIFSFSKGEEMSEHSTPRPGSIIGLEGRAEVMLDSELFIIGKNDMLDLPPNKTHSLKALENFKMLLILGN